MHGLQNDTVQLIQNTNWNNMKPKNLPVWANYYLKWPHYNNQVCYFSLFPKIGINVFGFNFLSPVMILKCQASKCYDRVSPFVTCKKQNTVTAGNEMSNNIIIFYSASTILNSE